jgi:hypothetical protein
MSMEGSVRCQCSACSVQPALDRVEESVLSVVVRESHLSIFLSFLLSPFFLLAYISCTKRFHCDILKELCIGQK